MGKEDKYEKLAARYGADLEKLRREQARLAKQLEIKDGPDADSVDLIGGVKNVFSDNKIISGFVVMREQEIVDEEYFIEKVKFPYIPGFRSYREVSAMVKALNKIENKPEVVLVNGHGVLHPRGLGMASHFSLSSGLPSIGVADSLLTGEEDGNDIKIDGKIKGKKVQTKKGAKPLIVSPGNKISLDNAVDIVKNFTYDPHKFPEALDKARKYSKKIREEMFR